MFVEFLFAQNAMHQQLTYRNELTDRTKLLALLAIIHRHRLQA